MKPTKHFSMSEFKCKDGTDVPARYQGNVIALCMVLERLRDQFNTPITIISGYRTKEYNLRCGGMPKSKHLTASAADIRVADQDPETVAAELEDLIGIGRIPQGGIGVYVSSNFVHYDIRGRKARWRG